MQLSVIFLALVACVIALPTAQPRGLTRAQSEETGHVMKRDFISAASGNAVGNVGDGAKSLEQGGANNAANNVGNSEADLANSAGNTVENL